MAMKHDENELQHNQPSFHFRPALLLNWHETQCFVIKRNWVPANSQSEIELIFDSNNGYIYVLLFHSIGEFFSVSCGDSALRIGLEW